MQSQLHIPLGLRFQCTFCGHCCHEYPVPLTDDDVNRLVLAEGEGARYAISPLTPAERAQSGLAAFSYSLDKSVRIEGRCSFLTEDKKCRVHDTAKPAMCRLFPYTFMHCPDGLKVGLSFASTGVLLNKGEKLLVEQEEMLKGLCVLFESMHPDIEAQRLEKWNQSEFVAGSTLDYLDFRDFSQPYLERLEKLIAGTAGQEPGLRVDSAQAVLADMFDVLSSSLPPEMHYPLSKRFDSLKAGRLDQYILMPLYRAYFALKQPVAEGEIAQAVATYLQNEERDLYFIAGERKISFADLGTMKLALTAAEQDLINRFVYVKLFTRLYFGPGFSMMPLLSGIFHLTALIALLPLVLKIDNTAGKAVALDSRFERLLSIIRELDRRLTAVVYSRNTAAMFELFALDPERVRRFLVLAN